MASCHMQQKIWDFLYGSLSNDESMQIKKHSKTCRLCHAFVRETGELETLLAGRERPEPPPELLDAYHRGLQQQFASEKRSVMTSIKTFLSRQKPAPRKNSLNHSSGLWRFAPVLCTLFIGIMLGVWISRSHHQPKGSTQVVVVPIERAEHQFVTHFFGETELWMHQLLDFDSTQTEIQTRSLRIWSLSRQLLDELRLMTAESWTVQDTALINYLTELEMILLDISNCELTEVDSTMSLYQETLVALDLLFRNERIRQRVTQLSTQI